MMKIQLKDEIKSHQENAKSEPVEAESKQSHERSWLSKAWQVLLSGQKAKVKHHEHRTKRDIRCFGIKVIDKVPWGTHVCQFYQTKEDLIDILVPYFKTGLENNEFCMWITSQPLTAEEAKEALQKEVKNLNGCINNGQIEILDYTECYVQSGKFDPDKVLRFWNEKENLALKRGYDGLRAAGNTFWFDQKEWRDFVDYEASVDSEMGKHRMLAICSYALHKFGASELLDVVSNHEYCLVKQNGIWRLTQSAGRTRSEEELIRKNNDLRERIKELNCLYDISHLVDNYSSLEEILQGTVDLIPLGLQFTEITCARIILKDKMFKTENFKETQWKLTHGLGLHGDRIGFLEVYYLEQRPESDEGPFSKEERSLINAIAESLERIIESNQANENIKHAHSDLNQIFNASIPICVIGKDYTMVRVNETFCNSFGMKREDVLGKKCHEIWQGPFCDTPRCPLRQIISGMEYSEHELINKNLGDGRKVSCIITAIPYRDINGELLGIVENFTDITERKKIEKELERYRSHLEELVNERTSQLTAANEQLTQEVNKRRQSEAKYRNLMEHASDAIVIADEEGNVLQVNKKAETLLGYHRDELINMNIALIHPHEDLERTFRAFKEIWSKREGEFTNGFVLRKDGTTVPVDMTGTVINYDNKQVIQGIFRDITERKKLEEELIKIQKMEAIGVLAGGIAHDFNNLLTAVIGNLSLIELYAKSGEDIFEVLEETQKASQQTRHLTQQLLTFSKGGEPVKKPASISKLLKETVSFVLSGSNVKCHLTLSDDLWWSEIDEGQITQAINNIIINADQATPQGGIIEVNAENMVIRPEDGLPLTEGKYIKISIKDQGVGIPEEYLSKIFDPYFSTKQKGSGLGLSITYSIIKKHEGHITVESKIGSGTTFSIYLPALEKEVFSVQKIEEKQPFSGKGKILFMDDQKNIRNMIRKMLTHLGYEVEFASDGSEAIEMYIKAKEEEQPFDVVILDLTVPGGMGGKEAIQKLTNIDPEVKAIVSSGYSNDPILSDYGKYGFKGMVAKPYEILGLSETLYKVVTGVKET